MTGTEHSRSPLAILAWPAASAGNRYTASLYANMAGVEVDDFTPGWGATLRLFGKRYDIFHIHWLERAFWRDGRLAIVRAVCLTLIACTIVKLRGGRLVWTAHDPIPHQMDANSFTGRGFFGLLWRGYTALLLRMLNGIILLSATHKAILVEHRPYLRKLPFAVTPHPHFKGVYPNDISAEEAKHRLQLPADCQVLLLLGMIRRYKNTEALIEAFRHVSGNKLRLLIAGKPDSEEYAEALTGLVGGDSRILLQFGFVADDDLQLFLKAADAMVIPFRNATNSGSVALALSFDCPVAVPDMPVFREINEIVGEDWIRLMPGPLIPAELVRILEWARQDRPPHPNLDALDWPRIAEQTVSFFHSLRD